MCDLVLHVFTRLPWIYEMCARSCCLGREVRMALKNAGPEGRSELPRMPQDISDRPM